MPHLSEQALNDLDGLHARILRSEDRAVDSYLPASVLVGTKLLRELIGAHQDIERLRSAGWAVADDGDPYEVTP